LLFFVLSGAELDLSVLPQVGLIGVLYLLLRCMGKWGGTMLGAAAVKADSNVKKYLGLTLLPQAGVAIGMSQMVSIRFPELAGTVTTVVLACVLVFELLGPVITKIALTKAGEIPALKKA
ncbi:MAG: cation:proton antiporter, partial [Clostridia bacterium]|nr:cation:proton antiporter [Clostridia bacterium]